MSTTRTRISAAVLAVATAVSLVSCSSSDPLEKPAAQPPASEKQADNTKVADSKKPPIVIGTANFPESEIIGQIWKKSLEQAGFQVKIKSGIGSREVYLQALQEGDIDIVPEYSGNLAQYFIGLSGGEKLPIGASADQITSGLKGALPAGLAIGKMSPAQSKDSYRVTKEFSEQHKLTSLEDLKNLDSFTIAANPEIVDRPFGPEGLSAIYGVDKDKITIDPISDSGGPLTVAALVAGRADIANVYTTSPTYDTSGKEIQLVTLEDPQDLILPQNILPLMQGKKVSGDAREVLADIDAKLTTQDLLEMNARHIGPEKADPEVIAADFVKENS